MMKLGHFFYSQRLSGYVVFAAGIVARQVYLYVFVHPTTDSCGRLKNGFIGQHVAHVTVDTDMALFHTVELLGKIGGDIDHTANDLLANKFTCLLKAVAMVSYLYVGRGIVLADELAAELGVRQVDNSNRHITHHLVVVGPRVEQRIEQGHQDEENEHALVLDGGFHLFHPDVAHVVQSFVHAP